MAINEDHSASAPLLPTSQHQSLIAGSESKISKVYIPIGGALLILGAVVFMLASPSSTTSNRFPSEREVGHAGPTPTGSEAFAIQTSFPSYHDISPLNPPSSLLPSSDLNIGKNESFNMLHYLGNLSPWRTVRHGSNSSPQIPSGCDLVQVQLLHRHGARYSTSDSETSEVGHKLMNAKNLKGTGNLAFLNGWKDKLGSEILTPFGVSDSLYRNNELLINAIILRYDS